MSLWSILSHGYFLQTWVYVVLCVVHAFTKGSRARFDRFKKNQNNFLSSPSSQQREEINLRKFIPHSWMEQIVHWFLLFLSRGPSWRESWLVKLGEWYNTSETERMLLKSLDAVFYFLLLSTFMLPIARALSPIHSQCIIKLCLAFPSPLSSFIL